MDAKEYDPEPLIEAVIRLDWSVDHPRYAIKAIRETVFKNTGDNLSDDVALTVLGRLLERRLIKTIIKPPARAGHGRKAKSKYFRVSQLD
jgi:hypothetical protein